MNRDTALRAAHDSTWERRASAARVLAASLDEETAPVVRGLLADPDLAVVSATAESLLLFGSVQAVSLYAEAYAAADPQVGDALNDVMRRAVQQNPSVLTGLKELSETGHVGADMALEWLQKT